MTEYSNESKANVGSNQPGPKQISISWYRVMWKRKEFMLQYFDNEWWLMKSYYYSAAKLSTKLISTVANPVGPVR